MANSMNELASIVITEEISGEEISRINHFKKDNITILMNQKSIGYSQSWRISSYGNKYQILIEDSQKISADDFTSIPKDRCRKCKKENAPYPEKYFERCFNYGEAFLKLYCHENGYCHKCALMLSNTINYRMQPPRVVRQTIQNLAGDYYPTIITYLSDGSIHYSNDGYAKK